MKPLTQTMLLMGMTALGVVGAGLAADAAENVKTELLSRHETVAVFKGIEYRLCRGLTSGCPEHCGSSGEYARFEIVEYLKYEKPGKYGDGKAKDRRIRISDFHKKPAGDANLNKIIKGLKEGDRVLLSWNHNYVTIKGSSAPQRPITQLEKVDDGTPADG